MPAWLVACVRACDSWSVIRMMSRARNQRDHKKSPGVPAGGRRDDAPLTAEGGQRRREVLDCAVKLFAEKGFDGTSINDIAAMTTLKKPSLYHYFPSKQSILAAVLEDGIAELWPAAQDIARISDPVERIRRLLAAHLSNFRRKLPHIVVFLLERTKVDADLAATYLEQRRQYDAFYVEAIREGQEQGLFRVDDPVVLAYAILGMVNWMVQWYDPRGRLPLKDVANILQRCALGALSWVPPSAAEPDSDPAPASHRVRGSSPPPEQVVVPPGRPRTARTRPVTTRSTSAPSKPRKPSSVESV
jgi:AcrR family transcriptional regulator